MAPKIHSDAKLQLKELVADAKEHGLVLFVGAGINGTALPLWNELLTELLGQAIREKLEKDPLSFQLSKQLTEWCKAHFDISTVLVVKTINRISRTENCSISNDAGDGFDY